MPARNRIDWPRLATELAQRVPRDRLHPAVLAWADASPPRERWAAAVSGGADSLALLLLLWAHWPERRARMHVLHFDHRLRGAQSRGDARFCRAVAASLGVAFHDGAWAEARPAAGEAVARAARHAFFAQQLRRFRTKALWLGHQQEDVAETLFMRLARGSGAAGLAAPRPVHRLPDGRVHLRPLLALKKREITAALRAVGAPWREDASNAGDRHFRNRVRHDVLPAWLRAASDRDALAGAARSRELLEEDDAALDAWLAELNPFAADGTLNLRRLAGKPRGLVRRALHRWLLAQPAGRDLARPGFDALLADVERGRVTRHSLGVAGFAEIGKTRLKFRADSRKIGRRFQRRPN
jgi:tRNA(Ile)-lysidine synthase